MTEASIPPESIAAIFNITILCISIVLNAVGIYCLIKLQNNRTFQRLILINLSVGQILMSLMAMPYFLFVIMKINAESMLMKIIFAVTSSMRLPLYSIMIFLTIDRLLACKLNITYRDVITKRIAVRLLVLSWASAVVVCIIELAFKSNIIERYSRIAFIALDVLFLCIASITYTYILKKILEGKKLAKHSNNATNQRRTIKFFKVSMTIILSFTILVALPDIGIAILMQTNGSVNLTIQLVHLCVTGLYFLALPITYIFGSEATRDYLAQKVPKVCIRHRNIRPASTNTTSSGNNLEHQLTTKL